jgi:hypothetical protein
MTDTFNSVLVINSITNNLNDAKQDLNSPFTFLEFLNYANILTKEQSELVLYSNYLKQWENKTNIKLVSINADIREQFITFLSDIKLKFSTKEEQRFFNNIDLNNNEQLTIAVPFFASKIKEISLYFSNKRNEIPKSLNYIKTKGSPKGIESFIKEQFVNLYTGDDTTPGLTAPLSLSEFLKDIQIETEKQYDTFNDYYDIDPTKPFSFYDTISGNRLEYFTTNTNIISSNYFINTEQAINNIINEQGISIKEIPGLLVTYKTSDLSLLNRDKFINYDNTNNRRDLKYLLDAELIENYMGVDMYYLSSNEAGEYVTDRLFTAAAPYSNILNINNPTSSSIPGNSFQSERDIGLFFTPSKRGILRMEADFLSTILPGEVLPNTTYIFPDPVKYGKVSGLAGQARDNPFIFSYNNSEFKNNSSSFGKSLVKSDSSHQNFYAYSSLEQQNFNYNNLQTFKGIEALIQQGFIQKEVGDIFGNIYLVFNTTNFTTKDLNLNKVDQSPLGLNNTSISTSVTDKNKETISSIQQKLKPTYVYNIVRDRIEPIELALREVFLKFKFNSELYEELQTGTFVDLDIFTDVLFIKTKNYFIVDSIKYSETGEFTSALSIPRIKRINTNIVIDQRAQQISNISNPFRIKNNIFYIKVTSTPNTDNEIISLTNSRAFYFNVLRYDINRKEEIKVITNQLVNDSSFNALFTTDTNSNIVQIKNIKLQYNSKQNVIYCLTNFADLNNTDFFHILELKANKLVITPNLSPENFINRNFTIIPDNFTTTVNFYSPNPDLLTQSIITTPLANDTNGTLTF